LRLRVEIEPLPDPKAGVKWLGEEALLGGGPDEDEGLEPELHQTDLGTHEDRDRDRLRIKSLVEELRYPNRQPVDLVEEETSYSATLAQKIYQGREARDEGARGNVSVAFKLLGHALRQAGLPQSRRTGEENRRGQLAAHLGGLYGNGEILDGGCLADKGA